MTLARVEKLHHEMLINLHDWAVVSWEPGRKKAFGLLAQGDFHSGCD